MNNHVNNRQYYPVKRTAPGARPPVITAAQSVRIRETGELFDTMGTAIAAAATAGLSSFTLEILGDVTETNDVIIGAGTTVKIIGSDGAHTVTFAARPGNPFKFNVTGGAKLTLGDGTLANLLTIQYGLTVTNGEIYIQDGVVLRSSGVTALLLSGPNVTGTITGGRLEGRDSGLEMEYGAQLREISGGYFSGANQAVHITSDKTTYNTYGKNTRVNLISGGSFYQTDPTTTLHGQAIFLQNDAVIDLISGGYLEAAKNSAMVVIRGAQVGEISGGDFVATRVGSAAANDRNATLNVVGVTPNPAGDNSFQNTTTGIGNISGGNFRGGFFGLLVINLSNYTGGYVNEITGGTFSGVVALQNDVNCDIGKIIGGQITGGQGMLNAGRIGEIGGQVNILGQTSYGIFNYSGGTIAEITGGRIVSTVEEGIANAGVINLISGGVIIGYYSAIRNTGLNRGHLNVITGGVFWGQNSAAIALAYPLQLEPGLRAFNGYGRYMGANGVIFNDESLVVYPYNDQYHTYYQMSTATVPVPGVTGTEFKYLTPGGVNTVTVNGSYAANTGAGNYLAGTTVVINAGSRSGYTFAGWTVNAGGVTLENANRPITTFIMPDGNVTVTANWVANSADLAVAKYGDQESVEPGDRLSYIVIVVNHGPNEAENVTLTDALPSVLTGAQFSVNGGANWLPWTGSYAPGTLRNGASFVLLIRGIVSPAATGTIVNTAVVSSTTPDPDRGNNTSINVTVVTPLELSADLAVTKFGAQSSVQPGETLSYTVTVVNNGPDEADNVTVTDALPSVLTGAEYSINGGANWLPWSGSYDLGTLANGASFVVLIRGIVTAAATGLIFNTAVVSSTTHDPDRSNNTSINITAVTPLELSADLAVTKTGGQTSVLPGGSLSYTVTVVNNGPDEAENVTLIDALPSVLTGVEYSINGGVDWQPWTGSYAPGTLPNGDSFMVLIRGTVSSTATGTIINTAVVSSTVPDPNHSNNSAIHVTVVTPTSLSADLAVTKYGDQNSVEPGEILNYTVTVVNHGPNEARNVTVTDALPDVLTGAEYSLNGGADWLPWSGSYAPGTLPNGASLMILIRGTVSAAATGVIINTAVVSSTTPDPDHGNNIDINVTNVMPIELSADLAVAKTSDQTSVQPGERLSYTVTVVNHGPDEAQDVTVIDVLPTVLTGAEFSVNGGAAWLPWPGSYVLDALQSGAAFTLLLRGTVSEAAVGNISNTAVVTSTTPDPNLSNNTVTNNIPVVGNEANLAVVKTACPNAVSPCGKITYTIVATNFGPDESVNVTLTDPPPGELCQVQYSLDGQSWCQWCPWNNTLHLGNLPAGASVTLLVRGTVRRCTAESITNTVTVSADTPDPNLNNNRFTVTVPIRHCRR